MTTEVLEKLHSRVRKLDSIPTVPSIIRPLLQYMEQPADQVEVQRIVDLVACDTTIAAQLKGLNLARFTFEMDDFLQEVRRLVESVFRN